MRRRRHEGQEPRCTHEKATSIWWHSGGARARARTHNDLEYRDVGHAQVDPGVDAPGARGRPGPSASGMAGTRQRSRRHADTITLMLTPAASHRAHPGTASERALRARAPGPPSGRPSDACIACAPRLAGPPLAAIALPRLRHLEDEERLATAVMLVIAATTPDDRRIGLGHAPNVAQTRTSRASAEEAAIRRLGHRGTVSIAPSAPSACNASHSPMLSESAGRSCSTHSA